MYHAVVTPPNRERAQDGDVTSGSDNDYDDKTVDDIPAGFDDTLFETIRFRVYSGKYGNWKPVLKTRRRAIPLDPSFRLSNEAIEELSLEYDLCWDDGPQMKRKSFRDTIPHDFWREEPVLNQAMGVFEYCGCLRRICRGNVASSMHACGHCNRR